MIRQLTSGVYSYLPLGLIVFKKIENLIREEMDAIGGNEFLLPGLSPSSLWAETNRLEAFGDIMFRIKNRDLVLAPTHEEVFTEIAKTNLISYKDLPKMWYQIQVKFRNEARPKSGVLRGRQFTMKDAYSFDSSWEGLDYSYQQQNNAYRKIFSRCGLKFFIVKASSGAMGGNQSEEFMVESNAGEDIIVMSEDGNYYSNIEVAVSYVPEVGRLNTNFDYEEFYTPGIKSIDELSSFLGIEDKNRLAKSRVYVRQNLDDGKSNKYILVLVCGDDEVNETKLESIIGGSVRSAHQEELKDITGAYAGSIGPIGLNNDIIIFADKRLENADELISGANKDDFHIKNIDLQRDVHGIKYFDLRVVKEGELSIDRKSKLKVTKAIEVGHIFKLGTKYSESLGAKFLDKDGKENPIIMGSYGIGVERIAAAFIEQNYDDKGIIWGGEISPFSVMLLCLNAEDNKIKTICDNLYEELIAKGVEVLYDDRQDIRPGFKFNDADLIGIPLQIIVGEKNLKKDMFELKIRKTGERILTKTDDIFEKLFTILNEDRKY